MASKDKVPEKVQEAIFNKLLSRPEDMECADCRNKSPTWVSLDFGVFVCIRCSGVHRQLGPHITRVRSTRLDGWTKDNIDIMAAIGNKIANDFYEYRMPNGYRKPTANSSPEECRRFVDEKYIRKAFAPSGYPEPVKEFLSCRSKGNDPEFGYSKGHQQQNTEKADNTKIVRKKSMSLDRFAEEKRAHQQQQQQQMQNQNQKQNQNQQQNAHVNQDLLSGDVDLLGGGSHDDFGDFKQAQSASPIKRHDPQFKKVHSENEIQGQQNQWNWNFDAGQTQNQNQNQNQNNNNNAFPNNSSPQGQGQAQNVQSTQENKVDFMKLYNQPQMNQMQGHQNHFMQMGMNQGWNSHHNNGWHSAGPSYGMMGQQQNQFQQTFPQQQNFQNQNQGFGGGFNNTGMNNMGYGMGGMQNMGYVQPQGQFNNAYPNNNNFAQMSNGGNRFF